MIEDLGSLDAIAVRIDETIDVIISKTLPEALREGVVVQVQGLLRRVGPVEIAYVGRG